MKTAQNAMLVLLLSSAPGCGQQLVEFLDLSTSGDMAAGTGDLAGRDLAVAADMRTGGNGDGGDGGDGGLGTHVIAVNLRSLWNFVAVAGAGLTNSNSMGVTVLNGDVGLNPTATCTGDGLPCTAIDPTINGTLYANDPAGKAAAAKADLILAYNDAQGRPPGTLEADLTGLVLAPGVYTSASTMMIGTSGTLTLDGQGDPNAVWIFQLGSALTVGTGAQVTLINSAKAANVFWAVGSASTLNANVKFKGTVLAQSSNSVGNNSTVDGRLLCSTGQITLLSDTINLP